jgi:hypothetical protein
VKDIVVIATAPERDHWVAQCTASMKNIPHIVLSVSGYELGKIKWMYDNTNFDRWFFLQDSVVIKDTRIFDMAFAYSKTVALCHLPSMYMGVYCRETLHNVEIPDVQDKEEAIHYETHWVNYKYYAAEGDVPILFDNFGDSYATGIKNIFGRDNLVLENDYLIKYKGTWR